MKAKNVSKDENKNIEISKSKINLGKMRSDYFLQKIYDNINKKKSLEIVKYNKKMQKRLNLNINNYKEYSEIFTPIEIEIIPNKNIFSKFININKDEILYYHIYFNDKKEEIKNKYYIDEEDIITKITITIDYQVKSFEHLFLYCYCIKSISFKKFYRNNITNMSKMFFECKSLKAINLSNFNTNNVTNMYFMFYGCSSLKELNLSNFNTNNVNDMRGMFNGCSDELKKKIKEANYKFKFI